MKRQASGVTLAEIVVGVGVLTILLLPLLDLLSLQRREVSTTGQDLLVTSYALRRLAEEESRLIVLHFAPGLVGSVSRTVELTGTTSTVKETLSVSGLPSTTGLWRLTLELSWDDPARGLAHRRLELGRLVVDRGLASRLPVRGAPAQG